MAKVIVSAVCAALSATEDAMKIYSVFDPEYVPYGQIVTGLEESVKEIVEALKLTRLPENVGYVPSEPLLQQRGRFR